MRTFRLMLLFLVAVSLSACTPQERIVPETSPGATAWVEIDADVLAAKIAAGDDFILVVSSETCTSCQEFQPIVAAMIATYGIVVYKIEADAGFSGSNHVFSYSYTPTVAVFDGGVAVASVDPVEQDRPFESLERLVDWLDRYVVFPTVG